MSYITESLVPSSHPELRLVVVLVEVVMVVLVMMIEVVLVEVVTSAHFMTPPIIS